MEKKEQKQLLTDLMKTDQEHGMYDLEVKKPVIPIGVIFEIGGIDFVATCDNRGNGLAVHRADFSLTDQVKPTTDKPDFNRPYLRNWLNAFAKKKGFDNWDEAIQTGSLSIEDDTAMAMENFLKEHPLHQQINELKEEIEQLRKFDER
jgi:hypothetical protein